MSFTGRNKGKSRASSLDQGLPSVNLSSSSSSSSSSKSLAESINAAISPVHTKINSLILKRMLLAVPPQVNNPSLYVTGLLHFGAVYVAFESLWENILRPNEPGVEATPYFYPFTDPAEGVKDEPPPPITETTRHLLEKLHWSALLRSDRIKVDIGAMTGWPQEVVEQQMRAVGKAGRLGQFLLHTKKSINKKPHLLLAYAYCLYMALLSGGFYIRNELMFIKTEFWQRVPTPIKPNMLACNKAASQHGTRKAVPVQASPLGNQPRHDPPIKVPLDFLDFDPDDSPPAENRQQQVKSLKKDFKQLFAESEKALDDLERDEITKESICIFQNLMLVVAQLDEICGTPQDKGTIAHLAEPPPHKAGTRFRDSIAIAKGRILNATKKDSRRKSSGSDRDRRSSAIATIPSVPEEGSWDDSRLSLLSTTMDEDSDGIPPGFTLSDMATVPASGFRSIKYSDKADVKHRRAFSGDGSGEDGTPEVCPIHRGSFPPSIKSESPDYTFYALVSNTVLLFAIAVMLAGYLYERHG